jgi:two-component system cell cycle response regulator DivK
MAASQDAPAPLGEPRNVSRKRVLIVEDNVLGMALFGALLAADFEILEAVDPSRGVNLARKHRPDLIVMDIKLPIMSGFEATRILKADDATRSIPVVLTSAYGPYIDGRKAEACGCDGYMPTPIPISVFIDFIHSFTTPSALGAVPPNNEVQHIWRRQGGE